MATSQASSPQIPPSTTLGAAQTTQVAIPQVGGLFGTIPWTGGAPNLAWNHSEVGSPISPFCLRTDDADKALKIYSRATTGVESKMKHGEGAPSLSAFADDLLERYEECGLDSVFYIPSADGTTMETLFRYHSRHTTAEVKDWISNMMDGTNTPHFDAFDKFNLATSRVLILNSLEPEFRTYMRPQLEDVKTGPEVWMIIVSELQSDSLRRVRKIQEDIQKLSLKDFKGENVKAFSHTALLKCTELMRCRHLPEDISLTLVGALTKSSVEEFRVHFISTRAKIEQFLRQTAGKDHSVVATMPDRVTFRDLLDEACYTYQSLKDTDQWPPSESAKDK